MKEHTKKYLRKFFAGAIAASITLALIPKITGNNAVIAATEITKDQSNTNLGVSGIENPTSGGKEDSDWAGCYVYFGNYNGPIKFRVLQVDSTAHTKSKALFLDCDATLINMAFGSTNDWSSSSVKAWLNDDFFKEPNFTQIEMDAVLDTNTDETPHELTDDLQDPKYSPVSELTKNKYVNYVPLSGEKVFLLDAEEVSNSAYGYSITVGRCVSRKKTGTSTYWWLRSSRSGFDSYAGSVDNFGYLDYGNISRGVIGVAPALNINQKSIIFNTKVGGETNAYKLTLSDSNLKIAVPAGQYVTAKGTTITVPYVISGTDAGTATRASILILDENNENIKYYAALEGLFSNSAAATGSFTFPDSLDPGEWGTKYHVYILAEDINGTYETDYASDRFCIDDLAPTTFKITYKVVNGTWSDDTSENKTENVFDGSSLIRIPTGMIASSGYEGGSWNTDPSKATISADTTFTYSFKEIPKYTVTYKVVNGTWSDGTTGIKTETVMRDSSPTSIPDNMLASSGYEGGAWDIEPSSATITGATTFTYTFKAIPTYTVTVQNDGNGTATADVTSGPEGTEVTLTATPSSGYQFKEWQVVSGGVTVTDNKFMIGTSDVTVKAVFDAIPTYSVTVQNDGNGTATADVTSGPEGTEVTLTATPSSGYLFKEWQVVSGGVTVTDNKFTIGTTDVTVKAVFEAIPTYTVTVQNDGNGTATADVTSGAEGTEVTLTATPSSGYQFKEWQVVSGGVTVTDNKFTIGTTDVTVKAVFEAEPVSIEPPKSTGPFTYTVVGGGDSTWTEGDPDLVVKVTSDEDGDHSFERYEYTAIDGTKLTDEQAPATSGSTVITIKSDLLKTLSEGKHTILINFSDNSITTTVTIVKKAAGTSNVPSTGEVIGVSAIAGTVMILSACSMLILMRTKKREEEQ